MITAEGWFSWAERMPGNPAHVNIGRNAVRGLVAHSAEGYEATLLDLAVNGPLSWHASNLKSGRFVAHFPLSAQCWHATAFNPTMIGIENEGVAGEPLTEEQIDNLVRAAQDIAAWKGYARIVRLNGGVFDPDAFLLAEHNQVTLFGGSATSCPSGRIPWATIRERLTPTALHVSEIVTNGDIIKVRFAGSGTIEIRDGDEWPLEAPTADFPPIDTVFAITPPP